MNLKIIDDFLPLEEQVLLENIFMNGYFPWYYLSTSAYAEDADVPLNYYTNSVDTPFFSHIMFNEGKINSDFFRYAEIILTKIPNIKDYTLERFKLNLTMADSRCNNDTHSYPHIDLKYDGDFTTCIYYVNDSSGDTFIMDQQDDGIVKWIDNDFTVAHRITPKRGRLVMFNGHYLHCGNNPLDHKARVVANINLIPKNNKNILT